jgi:hypothetical protein
MKWLTFLLLLVACRKDGEPDQTPVDLTARLEAGEVRAGVIVSESSLFGGIAAEAQLGDFKLYNDRVQYIVQSARLGAYMSSFGGMVIDADIVRPQGAPGRDIVNEWAPMVDFGRFMNANKVEVISDGSDGAAHVRAVGPEGPLEYFNAAFEIPHVDLGLTITTDYRLRPDSYLLEVTTSVSAVEEVTVQLGDGLQGAREVADLWEPGAGRLAPAYDERHDWTGFVGRNNDVSAGIFRGEDLVSGSGAAGLLGRLMLMATSFADEVTIPAGSSYRYTRYYGVGPSASALTDEWLGEDAETVEGVVSAPDGHVAGARVHVLVDEAPWTVAVTDADGSFRARVPPGEARVLADGRGTGYVVDLPAGSAPYAPYAHETVRSQTLIALKAGAAAVPVATGRGLGGSESPLTLGEPAAVQVEVADGLPFEVRLQRVEADPEVDERLVFPRPSAATVMGWSGDGSLELLVEPGTYDVLVHRGARYEIHQEQITAPALVQADLGTPVEHSGWLLADPHVHASPSPDGDIPMEERLVQCAALGVQLHFGTDHDHVADYRPLLAPLGLQAHLNSVVADEVSPLVRGHFNIYPVSPKANEPNGGAWVWYWEEPVASTDAQFALVRERHGDILIQFNHPFSLGMGASAGWSPGSIGNPNNWSDDFDTYEFLNAGAIDSEDLYEDLITRGYQPAPIGSSDVHGYEGTLGLSATYIHLGIDDPRDYTDDALREALRNSRTVVSRGPFLSASIEPGSTVVGAATVEVVARTPSWFEVDTLELLRDGEVVQSASGSTASFDLNAETDAVYTIQARSSGTLAPVWPEFSPWAMLAPIRLDVAGDGWDPPQPPLERAD